MSISRIKRELESGILLSVCDESWIVAPFFFFLPLLRFSIGEITVE